MTGRWRRRWRLPSIYAVRGRSMEPTLYDGDLTLAFAPRHPIQRANIAVMRLARIRRSQVSHQANSRLAGRARRVRGWLAVHRRRASPRTVSARLARHCRLGRGGLDARRGRVFRARRQPRPQYGQQAIRTRSSVRDSGLGHGADLAYSRTESLLTRFHPITKLSRAQYPTHIHIKGWTESPGLTGSTLADVGASLRGIARGLRRLDALCALRRARLRRHPPAPPLLDALRAPRHG